MVGLEDSFSWQRISLCFPEFFIAADTDKKDESLLRAFPSSPKFSDETIDFLFPGDYGVQIFLENAIPKWIPRAQTKIGEVFIEEYHRDLAMKIYANVLEQLNLSFETLESWRPFIKKYTLGGWKGHLQDNLDFSNRGDDVILWDYFKMDNFERADGGESPTDRLVKLQALPRDSLNEIWMGYAKLSDNIKPAESKNSVNGIMGSSISECIARADNIYRLSKTGALKNIVVETFVTPFLA